MLLIPIKCLNLTTIIYLTSVYSMVYWWTQELIFQAIVHLSKSKLWYSHGRPCAILCAWHWLCVHSHEESGVSYPRIPTHYTHLELVQGMQTGFSSLNLLYLLWSCSVKCNLLNLSRTVMPFSFRRVLFTFQKKQLFSFSITRLNSTMESKACV